MKRAWSFRWRLIWAVALVVAGCVSPPRAERAELEPRNLSAAKADVLAYVDSGRYAAAVARAAAPAAAWIEARAARRAPGERLAVVFDLDETLLSNLPHMRREDFGYHADEWVAWVDRAEAPALEPVRDVYRQAREAGVAVLFLTGRKEPRERRTEENLRRVGLGDYAELRLAAVDGKKRTSAERKTAARAEWAAAGWTIIATVGDQTSDLVGGNAERAFKIPNPFYAIP